MVDALRLSTLRIFTGAENRPCGAR